VHFFDFNQSLYDQKLVIQVLQKIRDEVRFDSLEALQAQLEKDKTKCLELHQQNTTNP
jgi:riboflavin kinase/FMN adenylyltransferase